MDAMSPSGCKTVKTIAVIYIETVSSCIQNPEIFITYTYNRWFGFSGPQTRHDPGRCDTPHYVPSCDDDNQAHEIRSDEDSSTSQVGARKTGRCRVIRVICQAKCNAEKVEV